MNDAAGGPGSGAPVAGDAATSGAALAFEARCEAPGLDPGVVGDPAGADADAACGVPDGITGDRAGFADESGVADAASSADEAGAADAATLDPGVPPGANGAGDTLAGNGTPGEAAAGVGAGSIVMARVSYAGFAAGKTALPRTCSPSHAENTDA
jgi:hypothetical protein